MHSILELFETYLGPGYYHIIIELGLVLAVYQLFITRPKRPYKAIVLTPKERQKLIDEWKPEPLVPTTDEYDSDKVRVVDSIVGHGISINGHECLNFGSFNFLSMLNIESAKDAARTAVKTYGVGSCGPRGFFGTFDAHLELEEKIAKFLGVEESIVYSYGFSTIASAIPAYSKATDIIFVDEMCSFAIQQGVRASKSKVRLFKHNDMTHLENLLSEQEKEDAKDTARARVQRKFIVAEGLYTNTGQICPLHKLIQFKWRYKLRLFLEESNSFGVLGATGRGVTEHFGCDALDVDLIVAELERSLASIGGFCAGTSYVIDHQRLSGAGYCFSASLPPYLARVAENAVEVMIKEPHRLSNLKMNSEQFHDLIQTKLQNQQSFMVTGARESPIKHLHLNEKIASQIGVACNIKILDRVVDCCEMRGFAFTRGMKVPTDSTYQIQTIRITIASGFTNEQLEVCACVLTEVISIVINETSGLMGIKL